MDRLSQLEEQIQKISAEIKEVRARLGALEARLAEVPQAPPLDTSPEAQSSSVEPVAAGAAPFFAGTVSLVGRTLMVLGGAFLLRALTDSGVVPSSLGALAGLAYGVWWLGLAYRAAKAGARVSSAFHGVAALLIAYPLIWETTTRLGVFTPATGAALLVGFYVVGYTVTWRCNLTEVAWMNTLLAVATALALLVATHALMPLTVAILGFALATEVRAYRRRWPGLRWPVALGLDVAVLLLVSIVGRPEGLPEGYVPVSVPFAFLIVVMLPVLYLSSIAIRTLMRGRAVTGFEIVQASLALAIGVGGALRLAPIVGVTTGLIGVTLLLLGVADYAAAFAFIDRRTGRGRNFYFYTTLAGVLTLFGTRLVLPDVALAITWFAIALVALWVGGTYDRITLRFHGAVYLTAAAIVAGLLPFVLDSLVAHPSETWHRATSVSFLVALAVIVGYGLLVATQRKDLSWNALLPQAIVAALLGCVVAGSGARWLAGVFANAPGPDADFAYLATSRTAVLCILAVVMAWAARKYSLRELGWLVVPLLVGEGLRLLLEDIRHGRPATLFITLALYGGALVATSTLMKKTPAGSTALQSADPP
jgi:hypothetical protein